MGDATGDGRADILGADEYAPVRLFAQADDGGLSPAVDLQPEIVGAIDVALLDLGGDGALELVVARNSDIQAYRLLGGNHVALAASYPISERTIVMAQDVNADGRTDIVGREADQLIVLTQGEQGALERGPDIPLGHPAPNVRVWRFGDVTGDGFDDLVVALTTPTALEVHPFDRQAGTFSTVVHRYDLGDADSSDCTIGDLNGDGLRDVAVAEYGAGSLERTWVLEQDRRGRLRAPVLISTDTYGGRALAYDLDRDGLDDLVQARAGGFWVDLLLQRQTGLSPAARYEYPAGGSVLYWPLITADVSCDGCPDIIGGNINGLVVFYGEGCVR